MPAPAWCPRPTESGTYEATVKVKNERDHPNDDDLAWANAFTFTPTVTIDISKHCRILTWNGRTIRFRSLRERDIVITNLVKL